ncbi:unnamed protein product [Rotaria sordida]|uniref:Uncharacterized protein n=1 Tax=Rotaria sordida TaxID=392033 RepID=A0A815MC50_9BILA|nr:unnamed protein product [Rotaria sordida]
MHYESSTNDQKFNVDISDGIYQYSSMPQLAEINHTRTLLLRLTFIEFVLSIICMVIVIYSFIFGDTWGFESYSIVLRFLPLLSFMCFGFGLIVADRYHVKGLCVFAKLIMIDLIITYLTLLIIIIIPICLKKYTIGIFDIPYLLKSSARFHQLITKYAYEKFIQDRISIANYWHNPTQLYRYIYQCHFLPDINNERETHNKIYCTNMLKLNAFVITYLDLDEIIIPEQSG